MGAYTSSRVRPHLGRLGLANGRLPPRAGVARYATCRQMFVLEADPRRSGSLSMHIYGGPDGPNEAHQRADLRHASSVSRGALASDPSSTSSAASSASALGAGCRTLLSPRRSSGVPFRPVQGTIQCESAEGSGVFPKPGGYDFSATDSREGPVPKSLGLTTVGRDRAEREKRDERVFLAAPAEVTLRGSLCSGALITQFALLHTLLYRLGRLKVASASGDSVRPDNAVTAVDYLVDPASNHMLVSKIKPCMSKYMPK